MNPHNHSPAREGLETAYAGRVQDAEAAAGNIERQEICSCGATRWVAINGRHRVAGPWSKTAARTDAPTMRQAVYAYRCGNNAGAGYAPYADEPGDGSVEEAVAAAERVDGWALVLERSTSEDVAVLRNADGEWMAIGGDAMGRGAWAVDITTAVRRDAEVKS